MSFIAKLKLVASKRERNVDPVMVRRAKLSSKIEEQLMLAKAQKDGGVYEPKRMKSVTNEAGERSTVEVTKRIKEWFWTTPSNKINCKGSMNRRLVVGG